MGGEGKLMKQTPNKEAFSRENKMRLAIDNQQIW